MWSDNLLIGFGGALAAGKDTVAQKVLDQLPLPLESTTRTLLGMSDVLREAIEVLDPYIFVPDSWNPGIPESAKAPAFIGYLVRYQEVAETLRRLGHDDYYTVMKTIPDVRKFLQSLGTEVGRELISPNVWVEAARRRIVAAIKTGHVCITGIRFPNELTMIRELGGLSVFVRRGEPTTDSHASETSIDAEDFHVTLNNSGTLQDLDNFIVPTFVSSVQAMWLR